jgi:hypothetical protein
MPTAVVSDVNGVTRSVDMLTVQRAVGRRGLSIWGGFVREEYLTQLSGWADQARLYLEMRDDPTVGTLLNSLKLPLLKAEIGVSAASEDPADQLAARWLDEAMNSMQRQSWRAYTDDALEALDFGFAIGEVILEKRRDGYLWPRNIEPRGQETVRKWILNENNPDEVVGFEQAPFRGSDIIGTIRVPLDKCVHVTYRGRKGNPQGRSLLRSIYTPYVFVKNLRTFEGIKIERDIGGTPVLKLPPGIMDISTTEFDDIRDQLDGLKTDETLWISLPNGMELDSYSGGTTTSNIREAIRDHQKDMLKIMFAQFLELGMDSAGTQALVKGSHDFFMLGLEAIQEIVLEAWNQQLVPLLFSFNRFPGITKLPEITWAPPGADDVSALVTLYREGTSAKILSATDKDESFIREAADLPALEEGEGLEDRTPDEPQGFPPFGGMGASMAFTSDHPAGQDLRTLPGIYERFTNTYQRALVTTYDDWARETARLASLGGKSLTEMNSTIVGRLDQLAADLKMLGRSHISEASGLGLGDVLGKHAQRAEVQTVIARLIANNDEYIDATLIPSIRERALKGVPDAVPLPATARRDSILTGLVTRRSRVAQGAGAAVTAIFEPQMAAGRIENAERRSRGESAIAVRWVLDKSASHCADDASRGTFGCPNLARVYADGWDSLPTVPAGNTSCLGNCRCQLWADFQDGKGWVRIT